MNLGGIGDAMGKIGDIINSLSPIFPIVIFIIIGIMFFKVIKEKFFKK